MKKKNVFKTVLMALTLMPVQMSAQTVRLDFSSYTTTSSAASISLSDGHGFTVEGASDASGAAFDTNSANFAFSVDDEAADWAFSTAIRWKPGTGLNKNGRTMTITVPAAGTLCVYARNASGSDGTRTLTLTQNETAIYGPTVVQDADKFDLKNGKAKNCFPIISAEVEAGTITVNTSGSINFYGFAFTPTAATSVDVTITDAKYATFANNGSKALALPSGLKAYGVSAFSETGVTFTEYNVIPAGAGVILSGNAGNYTLDPTDTESTYAADDNYLVAVTADMTVPATTAGNANYIFANGTKGVGFYKSSGTGTISKGKAYLSITDLSADNRSWDFTSWSTATITALEAERGKCTEATEGNKTTWTAGEGETWIPDAKNDNGYRYTNVSKLTNEELKANGTTIAETAGLLFTSDAKKVGLDNRNSTKYIYINGDKPTITIEGLKANHTVTIVSKSSSSSAAAYVSCTTETGISRTGPEDVGNANVSNVFTVSTAGDYTFKGNRALNIYSITVAPVAASPAPEFFAISGSATGIASVERQTVNDNVYYNLRGQRVAQPTKGLYIVNGKKVIIK